MRTLIAVSLLLAAACVPQPAVEQPSAPAGVLFAIGHSVLLEPPGCTGVRIGRGVIVTAKHCVDGDLDPRYKITYTSPDHDFALLYGDRKVTEVSLRTAFLGEHLYAVGFPQAIEDAKQHPTVTDGIYTGVTYSDMQRVTAFGYYGNSGGGVWSDSGELLGILVELRPTTATYGTGAPVPFPAYTYMVPIALVLERLN